MEQSDHTLISGIKIGRILDAFDGHQPSLDYPVTLIETIILTRPIPVHLIIKALDQATEYMEGTRFEQYVPLMAKMETMFSNLPDTMLAVNLTDIINSYPDIPYAPTIIFFNKILEAGSWEYDYLMECMQVAHLKCYRCEEFNLEAMNRLKKCFNCIQACPEIYEEIFCRPAVSELQ